jgi:pimeloyl-ACP methyl ester carboxylesterase
LTTERPVLFGSEGTLMGVLSVPLVVDSSGVAVLMFNAGVVPRIGPHRINVKVARALADRGVPALRFDLAGHGDSRNFAAACNYRNQAVADLSAAMDCVGRELGISRILLIGICSGAIHAFQAAATDRRVVGLLLFDGHWHRTIWTKPVRHWKRFRTVGLLRTISAVLRRMRHRPGVPDREAIDAGMWSGQPTKDEFAELLEEIDGRGVAVLIVNSGLMVELGLYSYAGQFRHAFKGHKFIDTVKVELRPDFDHTLTSLMAQREFIAIVDGWVSGVLDEPRPRR